MHTTKSMEMKITGLFRTDNLFGGAMVIWEEQTEHHCLTVYLERYVRFFRTQTTITFHIVKTEFWGTIDLFIHDEELLHFQ